MADADRRLLPLFLADVETTGLKAGYHRVIEVAFARIDDGRWDEFKISTYRFRPSKLDYLNGSRDAYRVNGYREGHEDWRDAPELDTEEARHQWREIRRAMGGVILLNQNVSFDARFMHAEFQAHLSAAYDEPPWGNRTWEVMAFSKKHKEARGLENAKLANVYDAIGGPALPEHRAEADVLRAIWVLATGVQAWPELWPDFAMGDPEAAKEAVRRWAAARLEAERAA